MGPFGFGLGSAASSHSNFCLSARKADARKRYTYVYRIEPLISLKSVYEARVLANALPRARAKGIAVALQLNERTLFFACGRLFFDSLTSVMFWSPCQRYNRWEWPLRAGLPLS